MYVNSSSNSALPVLFKNCNIPETKAIMLSVLISYIFTTPLFLFVLVVGFQKWRKQRSSSSFTTSSHIDIFTYNMIVLDLICLFGTWLYFLGAISGQKDVQKTGSCMIAVYVPGHMLFHIITCVERYLAVVYPVFYLRLRGTGGVRIRNIIISCVWLLSFIVMVLILWVDVPFSMITSFLLSITSVVFGFCSLSVLFVLIRPGPGEGGRNRGGIDQPKKRAFNTMIIITAVLSLWFLSNLIIRTGQIFTETFGVAFCILGLSSLLFCVPSRLVLPLLFLQREGKLPGCGPNSDESA